MKKFVKQTINKAAPQLAQSLRRLSRLEQKIDGLTQLTQEHIERLDQRDSRLDKLKELAKGVEPYQPTYGITGIFEDTSRGCLDRARLIESYLGNPAGMRFLDIGSSIGYMCYYFADRGGKAEGWDFRAENAEVSRLVGEINGITVDIKTKQFDLDTVKTIQPGSVDVVFILSVIHHITYYNDLEYTQKLMKALLERVPMVIVELAKKGEDKKLFWDASQPKDELAVFDLVKDEVDIKQIGSFPIHLADGTRPLYVIRRKEMVKINGRQYAYKHKTSLAYSRSPMVFSDSPRRYYMADDVIIKEYDFTNNDENKRQIIGEINNLLQIKDVHNQPEMLDFEITEARARVVIKRVKGRLLSDEIESDVTLPVIDIAKDVLKTLRDLHERQLNHNDVRSWNIIVSGKRAHLIDYGLVSHRKTDDDFVSLLWVISSALTGERQGYEQNPPLPKRATFAREAHLAALYDAVKKGERNAATLLELLEKK